MFFSFMRNFFRKCRSIIDIFIRIDYSLFVKFGTLQDFRSIIIARRAELLQPLNFPLKNNRFYAHLAEDKTLNLLYDRFYVKII